MAADERPPSDVPGPPGDPPELHDEAPVPQLLVEFDGGIIRRANAAALRLFGRDLQMMLGAPLATFVAPRDLPPFLDHLRACSQDEETHTAEVAMHRVGTVGRRLLLTSRGGAFGGARRLCFVAVVEITEQVRVAPMLRLALEVSKACWGPVDDALGLISQLAVPELADVCLVDVVSGRSLRTAAGVGHVDGSKVAVLRELERRWGPLPNVSFARLLALQTRKTQVIPLINVEYLNKAAVDPDHLAALVGLVLRSWVVVPLVDERTETLVGALRLAMTGMRSFDDAGIEHAEEFAKVAAFALVRAKEREAAVTAGAARRPPPPPTR